MLVVENKENDIVELDILSTLFQCKKEDLIRDIQCTPYGEWIQHCFSMKIEKQKDVNFFNIGLFVSKQGEVSVEMMYKDEYKSMKKYGDFLHFSFSDFLNIFKNSVSVESGECSLYGKRVSTDFLQKEIKKMEETEITSPRSVLFCIENLKDNIQNEKEISRIEKEEGDIEYEL